jgi:hypothetical protein
VRTFNYEYDKITGIHHPALYPGEKSDDWSLPDDIRTDFSKLNSVIETKYTREFLKVCAFYNKLFPSLKTSNWTRSFYNVPPFTSMDQERADTGTGISSNYLKQIIDQVTSRLGTITFEAALLADVPTLEYILYKDEVERLLRKRVRDEELAQMTLEMFHDAAILGYAHAFIDPFTHKWLKVSDFEIGLFESQFNKGAVRQLLYRDYAFPVVELPVYLAHCDAETKEKIIDEYGNKTTVDFKMYFDCTAHRVHITLGGTTIAPYDYPFEMVQMVTFNWDIGFTKVMSTSLFDLLYPVQRELNKINAKRQQLIRMYKGPIPVFNSDVDLSMKAITNGTGEALYVDSTRPIDSLMTVIQPTSLDPNIDSTITSLKTEMYELAGIQQMSFDLENMRSAAAVIAMDQTRDTVFQSQMFNYASMISKMFKVEVNYRSVVAETEGVVDWADIKKLIDTAVIELKPLHLNDPLGNKGASANSKPPDFLQIHSIRTVIRIIRGEIKFDDLTFLDDLTVIIPLVAFNMVKLDALDIEMPSELNQFMIQAFLHDVKMGAIQLQAKSPLLPGPEQGATAIPAEETVPPEGAPTE